jgi:hypothetical protein
MVNSFCFAPFTFCHPSSHACRFPTPLLSTMPDHQVKSFFVSNWCRGRLSYHVACHDLYVDVKCCILTVTIIVTVILEHLCHWFSLLMFGLDEWITVASTVFYVSLGVVDMFITRFLEILGKENILSKLLLHPPVFNNFHRQIFSSSPLFSLVQFPKCVCQQIVTYSD